MAGALCFSAVQRASSHHRFMSYHDLHAYPCSPCYQSTAVVKTVVEIGLLVLVMCVWYAEPLAA